MLINSRLERSWLCRALALSLCVLLSPLPGLCQTGAQDAGVVSALDPAATRNGSLLKLRDQLQWNDQLQTNNSGRLRVNLRDGSILSLGSNSQMRVTQHDPVAQQTTIELLFGRLRSQVVKLTQPNSKFEVRTPTAVAGVIGTDFVLIATPDRTTVIVFSGIVKVTPISAAGTATTQSQSVNVNPGQQVEVTTTGVGSVQAVTQQIIRQLIQQTTVSHAGLAASAGSVGVQAGTSALRAAIIAAASVAAGTAAGISAINATSTTKTTQTGPTGPTIPPR